MRGDGPLGRQMTRDTTVEHAVHGQQDFCRPWFLPIRYGQRNAKGFFRDKYHVLHAEVLPNTIYREYRPDLLLAVARGAEARLDETAAGTLDPEVLRVLESGDAAEVKRKSGELYNEAMQHLTCLQIVGFNPAVREGLTPDPDKFWVMRIGHGVNPKGGLLVPVSGNDFSVPKGIKITGGQPAKPGPGGESGGIPRGSVGQAPGDVAKEMQQTTAGMFGRQSVNTKGDPPPDETHIVDGTSSSAVAVTPTTVRVDSAGAEPQGNPASPGEYHDPDDGTVCLDGG